MTFILETKQSAVRLFTHSFKKDVLSLNNDTEVTLALMKNNLVMLKFHQNQQGKS